MGFLFVLNILFCVMMIWKTLLVLSQAAEDISSRKPNNKMTNMVSGERNILKNKSSTSTNNDLCKLGEQQDFQQVFGSKYKLYVYSAYYEKRTTRSNEPTKNRIVRIMAISSFQEDGRALTSSFYDHQAALMYSTSSMQIKCVHTNAMKKFQFLYESCSLICNLKKKRSFPSFVSVHSRISNGTASTTNCLPIQYAPLDPRKTPQEQPRKRVHEFTACVRTSYNYDDSAQTLEWIEFYRRMGVSHFTFYNHSIGPRTSCLMSSYGKETVEVLPFSNFNLTTGHSDKGYDFEIFSFASILAGLDCAFRYRHKAKYVVIMDFDELLVPRIGNNYKELLAAIDIDFYKKSRAGGVRKSEQPIIACYKMSMEYFFLYFNDFEQQDFPSNEHDHDPLEAEDEDAAAAAVKKNLIMYNKVRRTRFAYDGSFCSKYIFRPDKVQIPHIHSCLGLSEGSIKLKIGQEYALVHHYRVKEKYEPWLPKRSFTFINDTTGHNFVDDVAAQIFIKLKQIENTCKLKPTS